MLLTVMHDGAATGVDNDDDDGVYEGEDDDGDADSGVLVSAKTGHSAAGDVDNAVYRQVCRRVNRWDVK